MSDKKIKILLVCTDKIGGVGFYRSIQPHQKIVELYPDEFDVKIMYTPNFKTPESFKDFDIIHFIKGGLVSQTNEEQTDFVNALKYFKEHNIVTVMDIDDTWKIGSQHPLYQYNLHTKKDDGKANREETIKTNLRLGDYVTTTTPLFAKVLTQFNPNVEIFENAIDPNDERFKINRKPCDKLRVGFVMGASHEADVETMGNFVGALPKDVLDKIVIVLCGYDTRGSMTTFNPDGTTSSRPIQPREGVWHRFEKIATDNFRIISPQYKQFLEQFVPNSEYPMAYEEGYKRCWTKDINHYYEHYNEIDVLLAPLKENEFNMAKSELKAIEASFAHTAFIGSNFGPYTIGLKSIFKKGGEIDTDGNAILIDNRRSPKDWVKAIEKLVKHPEYVKMLQDNLYRDYHEKYDLTNVAKRRAEFYKKIVKK